MEIVVFAAKWHVKDSTREEQGRFDDGTDGGELAKLRTGAATPERTFGPDGFRASSTASDLDCRWTFSSEDVASSSVVGHGHRNSVSDVVENEAQSTPCFGCGSANTADCLGLPAKWICPRPRSGVVLVDGRHGRGMGCFGIRGCVRLAVFVLLFLRQESPTKTVTCEAPRLNSRPYYFQLVAFADGLRAVN